MNLHLRIAAVALLMAPVVFRAQTPAPPAAEAARPQQPRGPRPAPTNIKALPKDISGDDLIKLMRQYESQLGVECEYCHAAAAPGTRRHDFASDANPRKETARYMIAMTADLNTKWLTAVPNLPHADPVDCGTCHRGAAHPPAFVASPHQEPPRPPTAAAPPAPSH